jgi:hypothetical protein
VPDDDRYRDDGARAVSMVMTTMRPALRQQPLGTQTMTTALALRPSSNLSALIAAADERAGIPWFRYGCRMPCPAGAQVAGGMGGQRQRRRSPRPAFTSAGP